MKKLFIITAALGFLASSAYAGDSEKIIGGVIGGLVLGEMLHHNHHHGHKHKHCTTRWVEYYDEYYGEWVSKPQRSCYRHRHR